MFVYNEHPELFWLNGAFSIDNSGIVTLKSSYNSNEIAKLSEQIKSKTDSIVQNLNSNMSDYEKSLYLYEKSLYISLLYRILIDRIMRQSGIKGLFIFLSKSYFFLSLYSDGVIPITFLKHLLKYFGSLNPAYTLPGRSYIHRCQSVVRHV